MCPFFFIGFLMLYSDVYNKAITPQLKQFYVERNVDMLTIHAKTHAQELLGISISDGKFHETICSLHVCLALIDSIKFSGGTVSLMTDFINL